METIGARLKKLRLEKGFTLEDVHEKTKIHLNILKALEEDSLVNFSPVYVRGFLKIYCNFLGVDAKEFVFNYKEKPAPLEAKPERFETTAEKIEKATEKIEKATEKIEKATEKIEKVEVPEKIERPEKVETIERIERIEKVKEASDPLLVLNKISSAITAFIFGLFKYICSKIKVILLIIVILALSIGTFRLGKFVFLKIKSLPKKPKVHKARIFTPKAAAKPLPVKAAPQEKPAKQKEVPARPVKEAVEKASADIRLGIRAKEDCWVKVKIDGKAIFQGIIKKGRSENWQAKDKIELNLGNAGVAELEVNGKLISNLGRRGQAVKNIIITKEGLNLAR